MILFLDTSAIIKLYHQEKETDNFTKFLDDRSTDLFLTTSDISKIELHSAFLRKYREKQINNINLAAVFQLIENDFQKINVITVDSFIKGIALSILDSVGLTQNLKTLDSLQLASAFYFNNYQSLDFFSTADKKLLRIARDFFQTINPEEL